MPRPTGIQEATGTRKPGGGRKPGIIETKTRPGKSTALRKWRDIDNPQGTVTVRFIIGKMPVPVLVAAEIEAEAIGTNVTAVLVDALREWAISKQML